MSEWQPIETAPKDGSRIIIWDPRGKDMAIVSWYKQYDDFYPVLPDEDQHWAIWDGKNFDTEYPLDDLTLAARRTLQYPTHWMPLPEPPKK